MEHTSYSKWKIQDSKVIFYNITIHQNSNRCTFSNNVFQLPSVNQKILRWKRRNSGDIPMRKGTRYNFIVSKFLQKVIRFCLHIGLKCFLWMQLLHNMVIYSHSCPILRKKIMIAYASKIVVSYHYCHRLHFSWLLYTIRFTSYAEPFVKVGYFFQILL